MRFKLLTILTVAGILSCLAGYFLGLSVIFLYLATFLILIHQGFYIWGMFSKCSQLFFPTVRGKDYFKNQNSSGFLLRFDDGPHPDYTPRILDLLAKYRQKAIFFVTGENAQKYPELIQRMVQEGHEIGNHTYTHPYFITFMNSSKIEAQILQTQKIITYVTGYTPRFFGPPMGHKTPAIGKALKRLGLSAMMWDINSFDTRNNVRAELLTRNILKKNPRGKILLFHDGIYPWTNPRREETVRGISLLLQKF